VIESALQRDEKQSHKHLKEDRFMNDYVKHLGKPDSCNVTYIEKHPVNCRTADISASGEGCWPSAPTFVGGNFVCEVGAEVYAGYSGTVKIEELNAPMVTLTCTHSATIIIRRLVGVEKLVINCDYASTVHIVESLEATNVTFNIIYSSRLLFDRVDIDVLHGLLDYASYGRSRGRIGDPNVEVRHASTWDSKPIDQPLATSAAAWEQATAATAEVSQAG
jgi:hypothetical protein